MSAMVSGGSPWSPRQRAWLQALGHVVYRHGEVEADSPSPVDQVADAGGPVPPRARVAVPPPMPAAPARPQGRMPPVSGSGDVPVEAAAPRAVPARRPPRLPDRLHLALLRASGLDPSDPATQAEMAQWPLERLRGDAAAKRAFWPHLRALRRRP